VKKDRLALLGGAALVVAGACGRTDLTPGALRGGAGGEGGMNDEPPVVECTLDADCVTEDLCAPAFCYLANDEHDVSYCATRVTSCDDANPCTVDACSPSDGRCTHAGPLDADHDGVFGKAREGTPESCGGLDCDDDDPNVYTGAHELCDGKDDDCDGEIDEGATYGSAGDAVPIAPNSFRSEASGFAFDGTSYGVTYTDTSADGHTTAYLALLNATGAVTFGPSRVNEINVDSYAGSVATPGNGFLTAWADARQNGSYEIYATRFDQQARKLEPDQRLSNGPNASINPAAVYTGKGYAVVWDDRRYSDTTGNSVFGRSLGLDGHAVGDELRLTSDDEYADSVDAAGSATRLGVTYVVEGPYLPDGSEPSTIARFRSYDANLGDGSGPVELGIDAQSPSIVQAGDYFVVAWHTGSAARNWGPSLEAATLDARGNVLAAGSITQGDLHAKAPSLVSVGDRVLVVWQAIPEGGQRFELFYEMVSVPDLRVVVPRQRLAASTTTALIEPTARLGPGGDVGVVYKTEAPLQAYFTHLGCSIPSTVR